MSVLRRLRIESRTGRSIAALFVLCWGLVSGCSTTSDQYRDTSMDFGSIKTVAVMPLINLSKDQLAAERVRDVFTTMLMATGGIYVLPTGETARGISSAAVGNATAPANDEILKIGKMLKVEAVITGVVREYGDVRAGSAMADVISVSMQMIETQTGRVVWSASTTQGGIGISERLFGGGGKPLNDITEKAANDLISKMFE